MAEPAEKSRFLKKAYWAAQAFYLFYYLAALAGLRQWGVPDPWTRLDRFSGGFLLLALLWTVADLRWHRTIFQSEPILREASGASFDPGMLRVVAVLSVAELAVFLDYGHWRLAEWLAQPRLQWLGLVLSLLGLLWLFWTDRHLTQHFSPDLEQPRMISGGPYRYVRHPRYAAILASRIAMALALASVVAWALFLVWLVLLLRRIRREEPHLRELFGAEYDAYARRTARLVPGLF